MTPEQIIQNYRNIKSICRSMGYTGNPCQSRPIDHPQTHINKLQRITSGVTSVSVRSDKHAKWEIVKSKTIDSVDGIQEVLISYAAPTFIKTSRNRDIVTEHFVRNRQGWSKISTRLMSEQVAQTSGVPILTSRQMDAVVRSSDLSKGEIAFIAAEVRRFALNVISDSNRIISGQLIVPSMDAAMELESYSLAWALQHKDEIGDNPA